MRDGFASPAMTPLRPPRRTPAIDATNRRIQHPATHIGESMMRPIRGATCALLLSGAAGALPAVAAQPFQCGHKGGDFTYGLEADVAGLDMQASSAASTRDVAMNIYETLVTRDDHMKPLLQLAQSVDTDPDSKVFTFHLRQGVHFHNGKPMTSDDVLASFQRYQRVGTDRSILGPVDHYEAPDATTFRIVLKGPRPTFLESMSSITVPIVIIPKENANALPQQLPAVGTGPYQLDRFVPDSYVKLKRFDGYSPDPRYTDEDGFGGYKQACLDTVTFRMVPEPGARVAGLETGELQGVEDVPTIAQKRLAANPAIRLLKLENFWLNVMYPNWSAPPTNNLKFRRLCRQQSAFPISCKRRATARGSPTPRYNIPAQPITRKQAKNCSTSTTRRK
jgi:peptide/nickel transport system substrate-binding protein